MDPFAGLALDFGGPVSVVDLAINLALGGILSGILAYHYVKFGRAFGNRSLLAHVFIIMTSVVVFMITLAKSSFAVSVGLLGAVSIVRFRTPIKEPEELAYLFFAVGIGFGLGAGARIPTLFAFAVILMVLSARAVFVRRAPSENLYLTIEMPAQQDQEQSFASVQAVIERHAKSVDIRRLDVRGGTLHMTFRVDCEDKADLVRTIDDLNRLHRGATISYVEQRGNIGA